MGFIRILPGAKDRCGRQCIYMMPSRMDFSGGKTPARFARCVFYQMETVLEDVETQRNGITMVSNGMGAGRANFSRDVVREILHVIQVGSLHAVCCPSPPFALVVRAFVRWS